MRAENEKIKGGCNKVKFGFDNDKTFYSDDTHTLSEDEEINAE